MKKVGGTCHPPTAFQLISFCYRMSSAAAAGFPFSIVYDLFFVDAIIFGVYDVAAVGKNVTCSENADIYICELWKNDRKLQNNTH